MHALGRTRLAKVLKSVRWKQGGGLVAVNKVQLTGAIRSRLEARMAQIKLGATGFGFGSDRLGRYYTKPNIGSLLVSEMDEIQPNRILDLGAGSGSLSQAALMRWADVELLTVDIDKQVHNHLLSAFKGVGSRHNHIRADALSERLPRLVLEKGWSIDAGICNPPFIIPRWRKNFYTILEEAGFGDCLPVPCEADAALLFLAQNLRILGPNATLGIILPDSLVSSAKYRKFRQKLLELCLLHKAVRLPRRSFVNTDAQAHILIISKGQSTHGKIPLQKIVADQAGCAEQILVDVDEAVHRLDIDYHSANRGIALEPKRQISLGSVAKVCKRGSLSSSQASEVEFPVLHTTDITNDVAGQWCDFSSFNLPVRFRNRGAIAYAVAGDVLVARVGRNLEHKVIGVAQGTVALTDCLYKVTVPLELKDSLLTQLHSTFGREWLASRSYGVSAKQLTKADLLEFPIVV